MNTQKVDHMTYMDGMEAIDHSIMDTVLAAAADYDYYQYTENHVLAALSHDEITLEDFKALLSPAALPHLEAIARRAKSGDPQAFRQQRGAFYPAVHCQLLRKQLHLLRL